MKTRIHSASCPEEYLKAFGLDPEAVLYFDIETTGFRASTSSLYMIGWAVRDPSAGSGENRWAVKQVMAESSSEEILLLQQLGTVLEQHSTILAFNGDRFDLPYMREKYEAHGMEDPFVKCRTVDLYREIRPFKNLLGLTKLNQKSVEAFLSINRTDPYNGGELIEVYRSVRGRRFADACEENAAIDSLFLHNCEDVLGMLAMTPLLAYPLAMNHTADVSFVKCDAKVIEASFPLPVPVPKPLHLSPGECVDVTFTDDLAKVQIRPLSGILYHFFKDFRNYFYLPEEDRAIHKSVASFVAASHREKAKAQNCYIKKQGMFLPQTPESEGPVFQRWYKDPVLWFEYTSEEKPDLAFLSGYIHSLIRSIAADRREGASP